MWRKTVTVIASIMLIVGIGFFLFPIVSNFIGTQISKSDTEKFDKRVENIIEEDITYEQALEKGMVDREGYLLNDKGERKSDSPVIFRLELDRLLKDSTTYNENLKENQSSLLVNDYSYSIPSLNLSDYGITDGIYGYVTAESIGMQLPIYLGANSANMSYGAAHLTYTSLPLGGKNTNTVIAGHTGYVGRIFFDNLKNLKIGDEVTLTNYWEKLSYKVIETKVIRSDKSDGIFIEDGRDLLSMITCIRGENGNFDRYFVVCEAV